MKTWKIDRLGGKLSYVDVPVPDVRPGSVLVRKFGLGELEIASTGYDCQFLGTRGGGCGISDHHALSARQLVGWLAALWAFLHCSVISLPDKGSEKPPTPTTSCEPNDPKCKSAQGS